MQLSKYFTLAEMTRSTEGKRRGIPNVPTEAEIVQLKNLCVNVLDKVREYFGKPLIVSSGFRGTELNRLLGGEPDSQHKKGQAADIEIDGVSNTAIFMYITKNLEFDQCIAEKLRREDGSAGWIHVSFNAGKNRKEILSYLGKRKYVKGLEYIR